jgi:hypothetical protein
MSELLILVSCQNGGGGYFNPTCLFGRKLLLLDMGIIVLNMQFGVTGESPLLHQSGGEIFVP